MMHQVVWVHLVMCTMRHTHILMFEEYLYHY